MPSPKITALPTPPSRNDPVTFSARANAFLGALPTFRSEANAVGDYIDEAAADIDSDRLAVEAARDAAISAVNAEVWRENTAYLFGDVVYSPTTLQTYRAKTSHSGVAVDPASDTANWAQISTNQRPGRNLLINGGFDIAQRGTTLSSPGYTLDRWNWSHRAGGAGVVNQVVANGSATRSGRAHYVKIDQTTTPADADERPYLYQRIEDVRSISDGPATLSFWSLADAAMQFDVVVTQHFGTGGSAEVEIALDTQDAPGVGGWLQHVITFDVPPVAGKTIEADSYLELRLLFPSDTLFALRLADMQMEAGAVATGFERRPVGEEHALCQRYFQVQDPEWRTIAAGASEVWRLRIPLAVQMRADPTASFTADTELNCTSEVDGAKVNGYRFNTTSLAAGAVYAHHTLHLDAEL